MQILSMGAELFRADGRTDMTKLIVTFRNFSNGSKNSTDVLHKAVFLNSRAAARYRALASIIPGRERFSWNLSF